MDTILAFRCGTEAEAISRGRAVANETGLTLAVWYSGKRAPSYCVTDENTRTPDHYRHECFVQPGDR